MDKITAIASIIFVIVFVLAYIGICANRKRKMNRAPEIKEGMYDDEAFAILGNFYDDKKFVNGEDIYYWEYARNTGVKQIEMKIKNHRITYIKTKD